MSKRVLLTGAGGFAGHHILEHLLVNTDWQIVCLDSFRHHGKTDRIREVLDGPDGSGTPTWRRRVTVLTHDLRAPISTQLDHEIGPINYILSIASESHVDRSITNPRSFIENNVALILTLLEWTRHRAQLSPDRIQKLLHLSTDEVYGPAPPGHNHTEGEPHQPSNPYSASKAAQENILHSYWRTYNLPLAIANSMNLIGERQDPEKYVPLVLAKVLSGHTVPIHAAPATPNHAHQIGSRHYLHCRNLANGLHFLLNTQPFPHYGQANEPQRFNIVGEQEIDNLTLAQMIANHAGAPLNYKLVNWHESRPGHDLRYALDGTKMANLGWTPPIPLEDSLHKTIKWTLAHPHWLLP